MRTVSWALSVLALAVYISGCGDNGNDNIFIDVCGNGNIEGNEDCDGTDLNGETCVSRGFESGTLSCDSSCRFDTSQCSGTGPTPTNGATVTPEATVTPGTEETPTPTETPGGGETPTPTVMPTPGGPACQQGDMITITITIAYDDVSFPDVTGVTTTIAYPAGLDVPGNQSGTDQSRAMNLTGTGGGFFNVSDQDANGDNIDDQVVVGLVSTQAVAPGDFASVTFDCAEGTTVPTAGSFTCTADLATNSGTDVTGDSCNVASVTGP